MNGGGFMDDLNQAMRITHGGARLAVLVDLDHHVAPRFEEECLKLRQSELKEVVIDLTAIQFICSACLGELILTNDRATEDGRRLHLVIPKRLVSIFDLMSMRDIIETEVVE